MAARSEPIATANFSDKAAAADIDKAWAEAKKFIAKVGANTSSTPDAKKILAAMTKHKKAAQFVASWDGKWLSVDARVGGVVVDKEFTQDMSEGGDQKKWRAALDVLRKSSKLVTDADIKAFDDKHPAPDEVDNLKKKMDSLEKDIKARELQIKHFLDDLKPKKEELERVRKAVKALGG